VSSKAERFSVGDIFAIPLANDRVGYGQIVAPWGNSGGHFYFAVFAGAYPRREEPDLEVVAEEQVALFALSMDALLHRGHWQVVGNRAVDVEGLPWPAYKVGVSPPGTFDVVDYTGRHLRQATSAEAEELPFPTVVAPIRVEKALRALDGEEPWDPIYDGLRPAEPHKTTAAMRRAKPSR
jgi:hypothetical protein